MIVGAVWLSKDYEPAAAAYQLQVKFPSVAGLHRADPVMIGPQKVGKVLALYPDLGEGTVKIGLACSQGLTIPFEEDERRTGLRRDSAGI